MKRSSVAIVVYDKKILLLLRDNIPTLSNPNSWQLIGGEVEQGESHKEALKREMEEEIGVIAKDVSYLGKVVVGGISAAVFFVRLRKPEVEKISLGNEGQELRFFIYNDIKNIKLTKNLKKFTDLHGPYLFEKIISGEIPDPSKLGLK